MKKNLYLLLLLIVSMSGCATNPTKEPIDARPTFAITPQAPNGRLIISIFQIPKEEAGVALFHALAILGGTKTTILPFKSDLYDVSDKEPKYIGHLAGAYRIAYPFGWLEYSAPAGKRVLMLDRSGTYIPDFLEVNIKPGETSYIALSQYGFMSYATLGEIAMKNQDFDFCTSLRTNAKRTHAKFVADFIKMRSSPAIAKYMADHKISKKADGFREYCGFVALPIYVNIPSKAELAKFAKSEKSVIALHDKYFDKWKANSKNASQPFDLRHGGVRDVQRTVACSNQIKVCPDGTKVMRTEQNCDFASCP